MNIIYSKAYKQFLKRLYLARELSGLTQERVAQQLQKPQSFVAKCELGDRKVNVIDLFKFSKIYNVSIDFFYEGVEIN
ncbi:MAG: XRE family transcriptional regulator [Bacteroidetes bacterium]|nr:MAG: XRE family transcriptional regulator [Bacteroidota bacterium]